MECPPPSFPSDDEQPDLDVEMDERGEEEEEEEEGEKEEMTSRVKQLEDIVSRQDKELNELRAKLVLSFRKNRVIQIKRDDLQETVTTLLGTAKNDAAEILRLTSEVAEGRQKLKKVEHTAKECEEKLQGSLKNNKILRAKRDASDAKVASIEDRPKKDADKISSLATQLVEQQNKVAVLERLLLDPTLPRPGWSSNDPLPKPPPSEVQRKIVSQTISNLRADAIVLREKNAAMEARLNAKLHDEGVRTSEMEELLAVSIRRKVGYEDMEKKVEALERQIQESNATRVSLQLMVNQIRGIIQ